MKRKNIKKFKKYIAPDLDEATTKTSEARKESGMPVDPRKRQKKQEKAAAPQARSGDAAKRGSPGEKDRQEAPSR